MQDPDLIVQIFTDDATYDDPHEPLNVGREQIRAYWARKVCSEESDIAFDLMNVWVDGDTVIAEWRAEFTKANTKRIKMREVAILTSKEGKFRSLREYYTTRDLSFEVSRPGVNPLKRVPKKKRLPLEKEKFIGLWRDRKEMKDSAEWVASHRRREWKRSK